MFGSRIGGLTLALGIAACAHRTAPVTTSPNPGQSVAVAASASTDNVGFTAPGVSTRTFLHQTSASNEPRVTANYEDSDIHDVLAAFAAFSGRTIIAGHGVTGRVTVEVHDLPWDVALQGILAQRQLVASVDENGVITVNRE